MPALTSNTPIQRLPAPSLFVAPPSRNASNLDLSKQSTQTNGASTPSQSSNRESGLRFTPSDLIPGPSTPLPQLPSSPQKIRRLQPHHSSTSEETSHHHNNNKDRERDDGEGISHFPPPPPDPTIPNSNSLFPPASDHQSHSQQQRQHQQEEDEQRRHPRRSTAVLDAHWAALQSTLSDIELSASAGHVFGAGHASALEDLRKAQVELARAWGPKGGVVTENETEPVLQGQEGGEEEEGSGEKVGRTETTAKGRSRASTAVSNAASTAQSKSGVTATNEQRNNKPPQGLDPRGRGVGTKETDADLDAAEQRRKESDAYFQRVKAGVEEVMRELNGVSTAMRNVEMESREIWGDGGSGSGSSDLDSGSMRS